MKRAGMERSAIPVASGYQVEPGQENRPDTQGDGMTADAGAMLLASQQAAIGQAVERALAPMVFPGPYAYLQPPGAILPDGRAVPAAPDGWATSMNVADLPPMPGEPPFIHAARIGHTGLVRQWLSAGIDVNLSQRENGNTALMLAAGGGHMDVVSYLLAQQGIATDLLNADGCNALMLAVQENRINVVSCLLGAGADADLPVTNNHRTVLMIAVELGLVEIARILIAHPGINLDRCDEHGCTTMMLAAGNNQPDIVELLVNANASTVRLDRYGASAFLYAFKERNAAVIEVLFSHSKQRQRDFGKDFDFATHHSASFSSTVGDLWMDLMTPAPPLPGIVQPQNFFDKLTDELTGCKKMPRRMICLLVEQGMRWACAHQIVDILYSPQASWRTHGASRQQKMTYCLSAISSLPAIGRTGKILALYKDAGISAGAIERLARVANSQLIGLAALASARLAAIGSEMLGTLIDDCMADMRLNGDFDRAAMTAGLLQKGYCAPIVQAIVTSWQGTLSALREMPVAIQPGATFNQLATILQDYAARQAPTLFAQELARHLASHAVLHQLASMQGTDIDEGLHAQFQIQCDQLRQFCAQVLAGSTFGSTPAAKQ